MKLVEPDIKKPGEFEAGGSSPPTDAISAQLAEELAQIIADALVADLEHDHDVAYYGKPAGITPRCLLAREARTN